MTRKYYDNKVLFDLLTSRFAEISSRNENGPHAKPGRGPPGVTGAGELGAEGDEGQEGGGGDRKNRPEAMNGIVSAIWKNLGHKFEAEISKHLQNALEKLPFAALEVRLLSECGLGFRLFVRVFLAALEVLLGFECGLGFRLFVRVLGRFEMLPFAALEALLFCECVGVFVVGGPRTALLVGTIPFVHSPHSAQHPTPDACIPSHNTVHPSSLHPAL
jgi:hypothetical protein